MSSIKQFPQDYDHLAGTSPALHELAELTRNLPYTRFSLDNMVQGAEEFNRRAKVLDDGAYLWYHCLGFQVDELLVYILFAKPIKNPVSGQYVAEQDPACYFDRELPPEVATRVVQWLAECFEKQLAAEAADLLDAPALEPKGGG